jgi:hypothetical protein
MNDKETIEILKKLLARCVLIPEEEDAVRSAIGILSWSKLAESGMKGLKEKREKKNFA